MLTKLNDPCDLQDTMSGYMRIPIFKRSSRSPWYRAQLHTLPNLNDSLQSSGVKEGEVRVAPYRLFWLYEQRGSYAPPFSRSLSSLVDSQCCDTRTDKDVTWKSFTIHRSPIQGWSPCEPIYAPINRLILIFWLGPSGTAPDSRARISW